MAISEDQFALLADVVRRRSGLLLTPDKLDLVRSKLRPVAARFGFKKIAALLSELEDEPEELARAVTEAMTTNETSFFRDPACFEALRGSVLPALVAARSRTRRLRIWCAAASSGQEPYSLAMLLDEAGLFEGGWRVDLFATDLSSDAITRMEEGRYTAFELERGLPAGLRARHFTEDGEHWRIADRLRRTLSISRFNLLDSFGWLGSLDLILCRNVLFYFERRDRVETLSRLERALAPDGWLVLGATETAAGTGDLFMPTAEARGLYVKTRAAAGRTLRRAG